MQPIIQVNQLTKAYANKKALNGISFQIHKGEIFGFLGPSGSGKTTTVKILTSQLLHTSGDVRVFGNPIAQSRHAHYLGRIGILTDNSGLYERLSIYDNLELFCKLYGIPIQRIEEVLTEVNLAAEQRTLVKQLSKGMKQRVTLARAILHKPELLFLDEPTSALDPVNRQHIHEALRKLNEAGTTIFLTTHDMEEAESLCGRIAFINGGKIEAIDTPQQLRLNHSDNTITLTTRQGRVTVERDDSGAARIAELIRKGELLAIHSNEPTLGDIFVQLTGRNLQ
ncbi:ABC transporter ATP-binding protein [Paenibacillus nanensis]|uniref:ABC transporter ATP-binding protein n=1 Tax=Paenibacillus nanensis TaxID=393251 RepID=A0A3A1UWI9_9BACL|nr:ABC transporter ATP-binding protein [Paenibacillus nanensis]RIX49261.1 ABC transporter ATP-binding protein [Paenibacillus nanensis]